jgi:hypothetical protein
MNGDEAQLICSIQEIIFSADNGTRTEWLFDGTQQSGHNLMVPHNSIRPCMPQTSIH